MANGRVSKVLLTWTQWINIVKQKISPEFMANLENYQFTGLDLLFTIIRLVTASTTL